MLDLELPTRQNPLLYLTQIFNFLANKALIKRFIKTHKGKIYAAEYFPEGKAKLLTLKTLGIHYQNTKVIKMFYSSLHNFNTDFLKEEFKIAQNRNYLVALGTISPGIHGNEPNVELKTLKRDLLLAKQTKIEEAIIFRLGGLNNNYKKIIKKIIWEL